jgi:hypothetical protein
LCPKRYFAAIKRYNTDRSVLLSLTPAILEKEEDDEVLYVLAEQLGNFNYLFGDAVLSGSILSVLLTIISVCVFVCCI